MDAPEEIRARLHPVVFEVLSEKPWHEVNIRLIAARAGVSSATIYKYYESKEGLVLAVVREQIVEMTQFVIGHMEKSTDYRDKWYRLFQAHLIYNDQNPQFAILTTVYIPAPIWFDKSSMPTQMIQQVYKPLIREGRRLGIIDPHIKNDQIIRQIYMYCAYETLLWYTRGQQWQMASHLDDFFFIFWKAITVAELPADGGSHLQNQQPAKADISN
jgi:AcrR family transcriptional regulator